MFKGINRLIVIAVAVTAMGIAGCAKRPAKTEVPCQATVTNPDFSKESNEVVEEDKGIRFAENISEGRTSGPMLPVYFDFDKYTIRSDMVPRMEGNAAFLKDNPSVRIEIQGNCDERGTNEYNIALGEKRAMSAKKYLMNLGVSGDRIDTVSLGEEAPLDPGHDEAAWRVNRRDDFVIISR